MKLLTLQRKMVRAVMTPLTESKRMRQVAPDGRSLRRVSSQIIKPNPRLTAFERLEIYNRQYWFRVLSALAEDFPGLEAVLGGRRFDAMAKAYLADRPSQSFTLRNLGARLVGWLEKHPAWGGSRQGLALDMARLEWMEIEAFDGKKGLALEIGDLAGRNPSALRLRLQPCMSLLALGYPVDELLLAVRKDVDPSAAASNGVAERKKRRHATRVAQLKPTPIFLAVHRVDDEVYFRRLDRSQFTVLSALAGGKSLSDALTFALDGTRGGFEPTTAIEEWFYNWAALGWFCAAEKRSKGKRRPHLRSAE